jgi:hypothetical protein
MQQQQYKAMLEQQQQQAMLGQQPSCMRRCYDDEDSDDSRGGSKCQMENAFGSIKAWQFLTSQGSDAAAADGTIC